MAPSYLCMRHMHVIRNRDVDRCCCAVPSVVRGAILRLSHHSFIWFLSSQDAHGNASICCFGQWQNISENIGLFRDHFENRFVAKSNTGTNMFGLVYSLYGCWFVWFKRLDFEFLNFANTYKNRRGNRNGHPLGAPQLLIFLNWEFNAWIRLRKSICPNRLAQTLHKRGNAGRLVTIQPLRLIGSKA